MRAHRDGCCSSSHPASRNTSNDSNWVSAPGTDAGTGRGYEGGELAPQGNSCLAEAKQAGIPKRELAWFERYTRAVIAMASKTEQNPYAPGTVYYSIEPDGIDHYAKTYNSDYYNAIETGLVPLEQVRITIHDFLIPHYAESWLNGKHLYLYDKDEPAKEGWTEENPQFLAKNVYEYWRQSGDISIFEQKSDVLAQYLLGHSCYYTADNGLIFFEESDVFDQQFKKRGYGFYDTVQSTGYNLFASVLYWEAFWQMAEMYEAIGDLKQASQFRQLAGRISQSLPGVFWDERQQLLLTATEKNRQPDVWGSAYAVCAGIVDEETADRISRALVRNYDSIVFRGQVRQIIEPEGWECAESEFSPLGRYQNGAYWGTASGWVFRAIRRTEQDLAEQMMRELIADYRQRGAYECVHPDGYVKCLHYVASVGVLYRALKDEGYYG